MLGVDHDKIILLSTPFPIIPIVVTNCCCNMLCLFYVENKRCIVVLYCTLYQINFILVCGEDMYITMGRDNTNKDLFSVS